MGVVKWPHICEAAFQSIEPDRYFEKLYRKGLTIHSGNCCSVAPKDPADVLQSGSRPPGLHMFLTQPGLIPVGIDYPGSNDRNRGVCYGMVIFFK